MMSISRHFAEKERNRESQTLSPAVPAAIADVGDARPTPENGKVGPPRRQAGGATGRGPRGHLGGADGDGGDHGRGAPARAADGCSLGRAAGGRALAGAGGAPAGRDRGFGGGPQRLSGAVARAGPGGGASGPVAWPRDASGAA